MAPDRSLAFLRRRNFLLLWSGQGLSLLGDQFYLIALPWLVLLLTGDAVTLGLVLATSGLPRAACVLLGGALTDRLSPRRVMLLSDAVRLGMTALLTAAVLTGHVAMWMVYVFTLLLGAASGVFVPAATSIVPHIAEPADLQRSNAVIQGTTQLSLFVGPALAGLVVAALAGEAARTSTHGIGVALGIDALTFVVSVVTLALMRTRHVASSAPEPMGASIREGLRMAARDPGLRAVLVVMAILNFLFSGPFIVSVPVIAHARVSWGATAFGVLVSSFGGGNLLGIALSGVLPRPRVERIGVALSAAVALFGVGLGLFGLVATVVSGCAVLVVLGTCNGYLTVVMLTILQEATPARLMGRMMSLVTLAGVGLAPLSQAAAGVAVRYGAERVFVVVGALLIVTAVGCMTRPELRHMRRWDVKA